MRFFVLLFALAWPAGQASAAACGTVGLLVNGFDGATSACTGTSEVSAPVMIFKAGNPATVAAGMSAVLPAAIPGVSSNVQGDHYGRLSFAAATYQRLTITSANFDAGVGTDFSTHDFLYFAYACTLSTGTQFTGEYYLINAPSSQYYTAQSGNVTRAAYAASTDWTLLILSINYARNLGFPPSNVASVSIGQKGAGAFPGAFCYDNLTLADGTDIPNSPIVPGNIGAVPACGAYNVTITPNASPGGTDPIFGYHIYRSTVAGGAGPYTSYKYLTNVSAVLPAAFTEVGPFTNTNVYYKVLPYSVTTTAFGGTGYFVLGGNAGVDPQNSAAKGGVHEALLSAATAAGPIDQTAGCPTNTWTSTFTRTLTFTVTPTSTPTFTLTPTQTVTPSPSLTLTAMPTPTPIVTLVLTSTSTVTPLQTATRTPTASPTSTETLVVTATDSPTPAPFVPAPTSTPDAGVIRIPNIGNHGAADLLIQLRGLPPGPVDLKAYVNGVAVDSVYQGDIGANGTAAIRWNAGNIIAPGTPFVMVLKDSQGMIYKRWFVYVE